MSSDQDPRPQAAGEMCAVMRAAQKLVDYYMDGSERTGSPMESLIDELDEALATEKLKPAPSEPKGFIAQVEVCSEECRQYLAQEGECPACEIKEHRAEPKGEVGRAIKDALKVLRGLAWCGCEAEPGRHDEDCSWFSFTQIEAELKYALSSLQQPESARVREADRELAWEEYRDRGLPPKDHAIGNAFRAGWNAALAPSSSGGTCPHGCEHGVIWFNSGERGGLMSQRQCPHCHPSSGGSRP